jgi:hypothetical protein
VYFIRIFRLQPGCQSGNRSAPRRGASLSCFWHKADIRRRLNPESSQIRELTGRDRVRSVMRVCGPTHFNPSIRSPNTNREIAKKHLSQIGGGFAKTFDRGVLPTSGNSLAKNLWCHNGLDSAEIIAEFQRPFSKREYGGSNPPAPASQSGLCVWPICTARIRAVAGLRRHAGGLWAPELQDFLKILPKVSGRIRRHSQIIRDTPRRRVRSWTAWSGCQQRWGSTTYTLA